jgi:hypothetical protein
MASPSTPPGQALLDQGEPGEHLCWTWRKDQTRGLRGSWVSTAVQVHRGSSSATPTSPPGSLTPPR